MQIAAASIDTGGHFTHQTYSFCRRHQGKRYFAIKGDSQESKPIKGRASLQDVNERGRIVKNGVKLWLVGTDTAKDTIFQRLNVKQPGPGYVHFSKHLPLEWFKGFTAEVRRTVRTSTGEKYRWVKTAQRNEPLDCTVYALHASAMLDHYKLSEAQWSRLANDLLPDLFDAPPVAGSLPEPPTAPPAPPVAPLPPLAPGQLEIRDATTTTIAATTAAAATTAPAAPATPADLAAILAQQPPPLRRRKPTPPAAAPAAPFVSPFASAEWSSRL